MYKKRSVVNQKGGFLSSVATFALPLLAQLIQQGIARKQSWRWWPRRFLRLDMETWIYCCAHVSGNRVKGVIECHQSGGIVRRQLILHLACLSDQLRHLSWFPYMLKVVWYNWPKLSWPNWPKLRYNWPKLSLCPSFGIGGGGGSQGLSVVVGSSL